MNDESLIIPRRTNISMDNFTSETFTEKRLYTYEREPDREQKDTRDPHNHNHSIDLGRV